jgi:hypothetical protein
VPRPSGSLEESLSEGRRKKERKGKKKEVSQSSPFFFHFPNFGISLLDGSPFYFILPDYYSRLPYLISLEPSLTTYRSPELYLQFAPTDRALGSEVPKEPQVNPLQSSTLLPTP